MFKKWFTGKPEDNENNNNEGESEMNNGGTLDILTRMMMQMQKNNEEFIKSANDTMQTLVSGSLLIQENREKEQKDKNEMLTIREYIQKLNVSYDVHPRVIPAEFIQKHYIDTGYLAKKTHNKEDKEIPEGHQPYIATIKGTESGFFYEKISRFGYIENTYLLNKGKEHAHHIFLNEYVMKRRNENEN